VSDDKARVMHQIVALGSLTERTPLRLGITANHQGVVGRGERLERCDEWVTAADALRDISRIEISSERVLKQASCASSIATSTKPPAGAMPLLQRRQNAHGGKQACRHIADRGAHAGGGPIRLSGKAHHAGHRLDDRVEGRALFVGSARALRWKHRSGWD
jgi:hypothetical protein